MIIYRMAKRQKVSICEMVVPEKMYILLINYLNFYKASNVAKLQLHINRAAWSTWTATSAISELLKPAA